MLTLLLLVGLAVLIVAACGVVRAASVAKVLRRAVETVQVKKFGLVVYTPEEYTEEMKGLDLVPDTDIWLVLVHMQDAQEEEPYYSMIREFVRKGAVCYYGVPVGDEHALKQIRLLQDKLKEDPVIIGNGYDIDKRVLIKAFIPPLFNINQLFVDPEERGPESRAYGAIRGEQGYTVLIYRMALKEQRDNWQRIQEGRVEVVRERALIWDMEGRRIA